MSPAYAGPSNSRTNNPFQATASASPSPFWDAPSPTDDHYRDEEGDFDALLDDSLLLPPIRPNHQYDFNDADDNNFHLPSIDNPDFFDASPPRLSLNRFHSPSNDNIFGHLAPAPPPRLPPPSNQQATLPLPNPRISPQHRYHPPPRDLGSPDSFSDLQFLFPPSSPSNTPPPNTLIDLTDSPPQMAPKKRKAEELGESSSAPKTKKTTQGQPIRRSTRASVPRSSQDIVEVVDLEKVEGKKDYEDFQAKQQAEAIRKQNLDESNKPVKLAEFQCIICMDNPTDLTVTHCGHLFCSECLHSALNAGDKRSCPVCRTIITVAKPGAKQGKSGYFALEMKLMTANKKGKQPAR